MKFLGNVGNGPMNKRLNFGVDPDHGSRYRSGIRIATLVRHALAEVFTVSVLLVMAALRSRCSRCGHYIFALWWFLLWPPCIAGCGHIYFHPCGFFFFMAALRSRCRHYIFALWFLSSFFIPRLISAVA